MAQRAPRHAGEGTTAVVGKRTARRRAWRRWRIQPARHQIEATRGRGGARHRRPQCVLLRQSDSFEISATLSAGAPPPPGIGRGPLLSTSWGSCRSQLWRGRRRRTAPGEDGEASCAGAAAVEELREGGRESEGEQIHRHRSPHPHHHPNRTEGREALTLLFGPALRDAHPFL
jgi:hypothetical protein